MQLRPSKRTGGMVAATGVTMLLSISLVAQTPAAVRLPPKVTHVEPEYPPELTTRARGAVEVQLTVGTDGRVTDARITRSMPPFDASVLAAVRQWVFDARRLTAPVTSIVMVTVTPPAQAPRARQNTSSSAAAGTGDATRATGTRAPATPAPGIERESASRASTAATGRVGAAVESPEAVIRRLNGLLTTGGTSGDARLQALRERAFLQATTGRTGLAERDIETLLAANPRDAATYFTRGLAHFASAPKTAIAAFSTTIELQPAHLDAYRGRAWARLVAGDFDAARSDFDQLLRRERDAEAFPPTCCPRCASGPRGIVPVPSTRCGSTTRRASVVRARGSMSD